MWGAVDAHTLCLLRVLFEHPVFVYVADLPLMSKNDIKTPGLASFNSEYCMRIEAQILLGFTFTFKHTYLPRHSCTDINQFISDSGWFTFSGFAPGKVALLHVLARKAFMEYGEFMQIKEAVYVLMFGQDEKVFVGKALVLHEELAHHFTCFGKKRQEIREIDDELCHHTGECQWTLKVFPVAPPLSLEVEWAKKVVEKGSLMSVNDTHGVNEQLTFTSFDSWKQFSDWFFP